MTEAGDRVNEAAQHILRVAARLFARQGYDATPVRVIVQEAGVTKPTLYYHFGSKEGLAQALLTRPLQRLIDRLGQIAALDSSAEDILGLYLDAHFDFCREDPDRSRFLYALFFGPLGTSLAHEVSGFIEQLDQLLDRVIQRTIDSRELHPGHADTFSAAFRGIVMAYTMDYLYKNVNLEPGLGRHLVGHLLRGFPPGDGVCRSTAGEPNR